MTWPPSGLDITAGSDDGPYQFRDREGRPRIGGVCQIDLARRRLRRVTVGLDPSPQRGIQSGDLRVRAGVDRECNRTAGEATGLQVACSRARPLARDANLALDVAVMGGVVRAEWRAYGLDAHRGQVAIDLAQSLSNLGRELRHRHPELLADVVLSPFLPDSGSQLWRFRRCCHERIPPGTNASASPTESSGLPADERANRPRMVRSLAVPAACADPAGRLCGCGCGPCLLEGAPTEDHPPPNPRRAEPDQQPARDIGQVMLVHQLG